MLNSSWKFLSKISYTISPNAIIVGFSAPMSCNSCLKNPIFSCSKSLCILKYFAIRHKVIPPSFFGEDPDVVGNINDFENIINSVHRGFDPERITNEEHLQSQLTVFLKAKFPDMKVEREVKTKQGDLLDIVVDDKYVFELKVPKNRTQLRNLSAQVEEYIEQYPNLCVVIADISKADLDEELESNLTQNITEYADKYKVKFGVQTLIFNIQTRK